MLSAVPVERIAALAGRLLAYLEQRKQQKQAAPAHPARAHIHDTPTLGERVADKMAAVVGSWGFVIGQTVFIVLWIVLNSVAWFFHWDPEPWILLNLCMSTQAMYTGPVIMLSQNRQAAKDRMRDDTEAAEVEQLTSMNKTQLELLTAIHELTAEIRKQEQPRKPAPRKRATKKETAA